MQYTTFVIIFFGLIFDRLNIILFLLFSSILHELGHVVACFAFETTPKIVISPFGIKLCNYPSELKQKLTVLISGPLVNLILIIISLISINYSFTLNRYIFMCVNIVLLFINMLPVYFLDGGQIFLLLLDNDNGKNFIDIFGFGLLTVIVLIFSHNVLFTVAALILFATYYFILKKDLH